VDDITQTLAQVVEEEVLRSLIRYLESEPRPGNIEVTSIASECLRRSYYYKTLGNTYDLFGAIRMAVGKAFHEIPVYREGHEVKIEWNGVTGVIDEYDEVRGILIEKKTHSGGLPRQPYSHHVKQVEIYAAMLSANNKPLTAAFIVYFDVSQHTLRVFPVTFERPTEVVLAEIEERKRILQEALDSNTPPKRQVCWMCHGYCPFVQRCFNE